MNAGVVDISLVGNNNDNRTENPEYTMQAITDQQLLFDFRNTEGDKFVIKSSLMIKEKLSPQLNEFHMKYGGLSPRLIFGFTLLIDDLSRSNINMTFQGQGEMLIHLHLTPS